MYKGLSFYLVFGKYDGFHLDFYSKEDDSHIFRIGLGWVAFAILKIDIERIMHDAMQVIEEFEKEKNNVRS
jgi:hypothetical protein